MSIINVYIVSMGEGSKSYGKKEHVEQGQGEEEGEAGRGMASGGYGRPHGEAKACNR